MSVDAWWNSAGANTWSGVADTFAHSLTLRTSSMGTNMETRTPILVKHVGRVVMGPDLRRGIAELDGRGETVGAVVIMRSGEDALSVIERVRAKIRDVRTEFAFGREDSDDLRPR